MSIIPLQVALILISSIQCVIKKQPTVMQMQENTCPLLRSLALSLLEKSLSSSSACSYHKDLFLSLCGYQGLITGFLQVDQLGEYISMKKTCRKKTIYYIMQFCVETLTTVCQVNLCKICQKICIKSDVIAFLLKILNPGFN